MPTYVARVASDLILFSIIAIIMNVIIIAMIC